MIEYIYMVTDWLQATSTTLNIPNWIVIAFILVVDSKGKYLVVDSRGK
jgi:hypothetical protein